VITAKVEGAIVEGKIEFNLGITALGRATARTDYHARLGVIERLTSSEGYVNVGKFNVCIIEESFRRAGLLSAGFEEEVVKNYISVINAEAEGLLIGRSGSARIVALGS
jgi:hypothetical protein